MNSDDLNDLRAMSADQPPKDTEVSDPLESALDEALEQTFPASDPVSITPAISRTTK